MKRLKETQESIEHKRSRIEVTESELEEQARRFPGETITHTDISIQPKAFTCEDDEHSFRQHVLRYGGRACIAERVRIDNQRFEKVYYEKLANGIPWSKGKHNLKKLAPLTRIPTLMESCLGVLGYCLDKFDIGLGNSCVSWDHIGHRLYAFRRQDPTPIRTFGLEILFHLFPLQFSEFNSHLIIRRTITRAQLSKLSSPTIGKFLKVLDLSGSVFNDTLIDCITRIPSLKILSLSGTTISDQGVSDLFRPFFYHQINSTGINLNALNLSRTGITGKVLVVLGKLKELSVLDVSNTNVLMDEIGKTSWKVLPPSTPILDDINEDIIAKDWQSLSETEQQSILSSRFFYQSDVRRNDIWNLILCCAENQEEIDMLRIQDPYNEDLVIEEFLDGDLNPKYYNKKDDREFLDSVWLRKIANTPIKLLKLIRNVNNNIVAAPAAPSQKLVLKNKTNGSKFSFKPVAVEIEREVDTLFDVPAPPEKKKKRIMELPVANKDVIVKNKPLKKKYDPFAASAIKLKPLQPPLTGKSLSVPLPASKSL